MFYKEDKDVRKALKKLDNLHQRIDELRPFPPDLSQTLQEKLRIEWTYNSNAIEGNTLTYGETAFFLREGLTSEGKPLKDYLEAKNHVETIDGLHEIIQNKRKLTESLIKELHFLLLRNVQFTYAKGADGNLIKKPVNAGKYKMQPNHVLTLTGEIHYYTDPVHVKDEMEKLIKWYRTEDTLHILEKAAIFHYRFVAIHPFDDGNGRMARLLMNLILMQAGFPPCIVKNEHRRKYLETLNLADKKKDYIPFILFIEQELEQTMNSILNIVQGKKITQLPKSEISLNRNQRDKKILEILNNGPFSIGQVLEIFQSIKRPTLKSDLKRLINDGKIKKSGVGKGVVYSKLTG